MVLVSRYVSKCIDKLYGAVYISICRAIFKDQIATFIFLQQIPTIFICFYLACKEAFYNEGCAISIRIVYSKKVV